MFCAALIECDWRTAQNNLSNPVWLSRHVCRFGGKTTFPHSIVVFKHSIDLAVQFLWPYFLFPSQTSSLPVVVISNSSQQQSAWAAVLWFNMLCSDPEVRSKSYCWFMKSLNHHNRIVKKKKYLHHYKSLFVCASRTSIFLKPLLQPLGHSLGKC